MSGLQAVAAHQMLGAELRGFRRRAFLQSGKKLREQHELYVLAVDPGAPRVRDLYDEHVRARYRLTAFWHRSRLTPVVLEERLGLWVAAVEDLLKDDMLAIGLGARAVDDETVLRALELRVSTKAAETGALRRW